MTEIKDEDISIRNVKVKYLNDIYAKFGFNEILNCYGDIFFIDSYDHQNRTYIGRRIKWSLELSEEQYLIKSEIISSGDGREYEYTEYQITQMT